MTLETLAIKVVEATEAAAVDFMFMGELGAAAYGAPLSIKEIDLLVAVSVTGGVAAVIKSLAPLVEFEPQVVFDTLTWGRRQVGQSRSTPPFKVELFEVFEDAFVQEEFRRRQQVFVPMLGRSTWLPTPEDVIVQKLRWGRSKDLDDARDVLAVQGPETLDMAYVESWCARHGTTARLEAALAGIPPM